MNSCHHVVNLVFGSSHDSFLISFLLFCWLVSSHIASFWVGSFSLYFPWAIILDVLDWHCHDILLNACNFDDDDDDYFAS